MDATELKQRYPIERAWRDLGLPGKPGKICHSPFPQEHSHSDANPSFSVYGEGTRWKDFGTGEGGDVFDLVAKARGGTIATAIEFVRERLGDVRADRPPACQVAAKIPPLRIGTESELRELADRRGFGVAALHLAQQRGFLFLCELWKYPAWCISDSRRALFEFRRLNGEKWPPYGRLPCRKSHCYGAGKRWPIGTVEGGSFPKIAMVEGAPDLLAAFHFLVVEGKERTVAPVAVLGAANHSLDPTALRHFAGKEICLFPHLDPAGRTAARAWAQQLKEAGAARVTAFDLAGLVKADGTAGKDLADVCQIDPDCLASEPKFLEVLP